MKARENPFRQERVRTIRYRFFEGDWEEQFRRLAEMGFRGAVVGPEGSGKSTLLEDLEQQFAREGKRVRWLRLRREREETARLVRSEVSVPIGNGEVVLLDGAEQLRWRHWRRVMEWSRNSGGLVVTSHVPCRIKTWLETKTSLELLEMIVRELCPERAEKWKPQLRPLFMRNFGNVRECLREMYDWCAWGR